MLSVEGRVRLAGQTLGSGAAQKNQPAKSGASPSEILCPRLAAWLAFTGYHFTAGQVLLSSPLIKPRLKFTGAPCYAASRSLIHYLGA